MHFYVYAGAHMCGSMLAHACKLSTGEVNTGGSLGELTGPLAMLN